ncbi:MAG: alanine racemase, partial [Thermoleophilia bacterium]
MTSDARSTAVIDLDALRHNAARLTRAAGDAELMAVVKGNGYGHGAVACARAALNGGAGSLAVASVEEAEELRLGGISARILIMSPLAGAAPARAVAADCEVVVGSAACVRAIAAAAAHAGRRARVHVEVDTGMGRLGVAPADVRALADSAAAAGCEVAGLMTHFATADERDGP